MQRPQPVVVGYDGSGRALSALTWAAREAAARGLPLRVIQALPYAVPTVPPRRPPVEHLDEVEGVEVHDVLADVLADGIRTARTLLDEGQVSGVSIAGHPAGVLIDASQGASLVVVGQQSQDSPVSSAVGSTSRILAGHAHCPVVIARGACGPDRSALPVVVRVAAGAGARAALDFAADTAQLRGVELVLVAAWSLPPTRDWPRAAHGLDSVAELARSLRTQAATLAERSEGHVRQGHPSLSVRTRLEHVDATTALDRASRQAGLLVVGTDTRAEAGGATGRVPGERRASGRTVQEVVGRSACPVVVVPACVASASVDA